MFDPRNIFFFLLIIFSFSACEIENELPINEIRQTPRISVLPTTTVEADENSTINFEVNLSWDFPKEVRVDYQTIAETAEETVDFLGQNGTILFAPGEISQIVAVPVIGDNIFEGDETLKLELANPCLLYTSPSPRDRG